MPALGGRRSTDPHLQPPVDQGQPPNPGEEPSRQEASQEEPGHHRGDHGGDRLVGVPQDQGKGPGPGDLHHQRGGA